MPSPTALEIEMNAAERDILEHVVRQGTNPQWLVTRAKIILKAASGESNRQIAKSLGITRNTVQLWRGRWQASRAQRFAETAEVEGQGGLRARIEASLQDDYRSGTPAKFTAEQVVQMVAISCEEVAKSDYPISHWTVKEVAAEAVKRGIVSTISVRQMERFLKRGGS
jgi:putative transposase